jgi:hypothetical protein
MSRVEWIPSTEDLMPLDASCRIGGPRYRPEG